MKTIPFDMVADSRTGKLWLNSDERCVARFSDLSFEIWNSTGGLAKAVTSKNLTPLTRENFTEFCKCIEENYGYIIPPYTLKFAEEDKFGHYYNDLDEVLSTYNDFVFNNGSNCEDIVAAGYGFSNGDEPNDAVYSAASYLGQVFHLMQQVGGKLCYRGIEVRATRMEQTTGGEIAFDEVVWWGNRADITIQEMLGYSGSLSDIEPIPYKRRT